MTSTTQGSAPALPPWHAAYSAPKRQAPAITRDVVLEMLRNGNNVAGKDLVLVDLRRIDHKVCAVITLLQRCLKA
jgi:arsenical-resistance protein 2